MDIFEIAEPPHCVSTNNVRDLPPMPLLFSAAARERPAPALTHGRARMLRAYSSRRHRLRLHLAPPTLCDWCGSIGVGRVRLVAYYSIWSPRHHLGRDCTAIGADGQDFRLEGPAPERTRQGARAPAGSCSQTVLVVAVYVAAHIGPPIESRCRMTPTA